jgi:hypothetical protein
MYIQFAIAAYQTCSTQRTMPAMLLLSLLRCYCCLQ